MKITLTEFEESLKLYVSREICPKLSDWRKWVLPVFIGALIPKAEKAFYDNKDILISSGFVEDNLIDIDTLYDKFHAIAKDSGDIEQTIPYIGSLKLSATDIETFYQIAKSNYGQRIS